MERKTPKREPTQDERCRVCLEITENPISLVDNVNFNEETISYWDVLLSITNLETADDSNTPQKICASCAERVEATYEFKALCESSDKILQSELTSDLEDTSSIQSDFKIDFDEENLVCISSEIKSSPNSDVSTTNSNRIPDVNTTLSDPNCAVEFKVSSDTFPVYQCNSEIVSSEKDTFTDSNSVTQFEINSRLNHSINKIAEGTLPFNNHVCEDCGLKFVLIRNLILHKCTKKFPAFCPVCHYKPTSLINYHNHCNIHKSEKDEKKCTFCDYNYADKVDYKNHLKNSHLSEMMECNICKNVYFTSHSLRVHMKKEHAYEKELLQKKNSSVRNVANSSRRKMRRMHTRSVQRKLDSEY